MNSPSKIEFPGHGIKEPDKLYEKRVFVHPKRIDGPFRRFKWLVMLVTLGIYYGTPWIRWDRGPYAPDQAVLIDLAHRRFYMFGIEIWPHEFYFVAGLLIMAGIGLFLVTSAVGRAWCGYTCPQTVWTDLFQHVDRFVDGDRNARIRLDAAPWGPRKIAKRALKWTIYLVIGFWTGGAWIMYFADAPTLTVDFWSGEAAPIAYATVAVLTFTTFLLGGFAREQVCIYMCPWPRIQAALTDEDALSVTYRRDRGEPRGPHKKGDSWQGRGDCIDCGQCVAACPMGIDIRDGDQLECINCALCIDACDDIMTKIGRPQGLIAYDTVRNVERRLKGEKPRYRFVRVRTILYAAAIAAVAGIMLFALTSKSTIDLSVQRDRNPTFVRLSDGSVRNGYTVKLENRSPTRATFSVKIESPYPLAAKAVGLGEEPLSVSLASGENRVLRLYLTSAATEEHRGASFPVSVDTVNTISHEHRSVTTNFLTGEQP